MVRYLLLLLFLLIGCDQKPSEEEEKRMFSYCKQEVENYFTTLSNNVYASEFDICYEDLTYRLCPCGQYEVHFMKESPIKEVLCTEDNKNTLLLKHNKSKYYYNELIGLKKIKRYKRLNSETKYSLDVAIASFSQEMRYYENSLKKYNEYCGEGK